MPQGGARSAGKAQRIDPLRALTCRRPPIPVRNSTVLMIGAGLVPALLLSTSGCGLGRRPWFAGATRTRWPCLTEDVHDRGVHQQRGRRMPAGVAPTWASTPSTPSTA